MSEKQTITLTISPLIAAHLEVIRQEMIVRQKRAAEHAPQGTTMIITLHEPTLETAAKQALCMGLNVRRRGPIDDDGLINGMLAAPLPLGDRLDGR